MGDVLLVPGVRCNLLKKDLLMPLSIEVLPEEEKMVVKIHRFKEKDEKQIKEAV